jgi:hypothetical protein
MGKRSILRAAFFTIALFSFSCPVASDPDLLDTDVPEAIQIVTSANSRSVRPMSQEEAVQLFLGYRNRLNDGTLVTLIDLPVGPTRKHFYLRLTNKNPVQVRATWSRLVFSGRVRPPIEADSPKEALEWLASMPNAIGYLPASIQDQRLKVLLVVPND